MSTVTFSLQGADVVREFLRVRPERIETELLTATQLLTGNLTAEARSNVTSDTGTTQASIMGQVSISSGMVVGTVYADENIAPWAPWVELGTGSYAGSAGYFPNPWGRLYDWAMRHGMSPYGVARAIANRGGTEGQHFMRDAFQSYRDFIPGWYMMAIGRAMLR